MKFDRSYLFIILSSLALFIVLIIQVNWILETASTKEEIFNEKATMVLTKTAEALATDKQSCKNMETCVGQNEKRKLDSLFNHFMKVYKINIKYYFDVKPGAFNCQFANDTTSITFGKEVGCYTTSLPNPNRSMAATELKLVFPEQEEYIMEEMGTLFITSMALIILVIIMSARTILSLNKEKKISEHTTDFLNNMTHEFKTPITNIALAGKMLQKDNNIKHEEKIKQYTGIILDENEKLRLQVEQVLSMTALERGEIPLQKTELDFHDLINSCIKRLGIQIENRQGNLKVNLDANNFVVMGDKTHLTNTLCNLIDNAIKYSVEKPEIIIQTSNAIDNLIIEISDKGVGIDSEYHDKVFDKFFRVPTGNVHDVKGFGLGLAYVKKIIELHGGKIELESEIELGTTFKIKLPYV